MIFISASASASPFTSSVKLIYPAISIINS